MAQPDEMERRPERVIILDADDPMTEIHGRFVWQEEHDRVVEEVRRQAFAEGYSAGHTDAEQAHHAPVEFVLRRRRTVWGRVKLAMLLLGFAAFLLALPVVVFGS
jgi:hypothetical protein